MVRVLPYDSVHVYVEAERGILQEMSEYFTFTVPGAEFMPAVKNKIWDGKIRLLDYRSQRIYAGLLLYIKKFCDDRDYPVEFSRQLAYMYEEREVDHFLSNLGATKQPRDYQAAAVKACVRQGGRATLLSPTASGKSFIIYMLARYYATKTLLIVPTLGLVSQMRDDFIEYGFDPSRIETISSGKEKLTEADVVISTWQSIWKLPSSWFKPFGMIVGDEAHHFKGKSLVSLMEKTSNVPVKIATTGTLDGTEVHKLVIEGLFGPVYKVTTSAELIEKGTLAELKIDCILIGHSEQVRKLVSGGKKRATYPEEMAVLTANEKRTRFIARMAGSLKGATLVLYEFVERHGKPIYEQIKQMYPDRTVVFISGDVDVSQRDDVRKLIAEGIDVIVVASYGTFSTGINAPNLRNLILASPTKSVIRVLQSVGRLLRKSETVKKVSLYDIGDDMSWKSTKNHTLGHFKERMKIYTTEGFAFTSRTISL